MLSQKTPSHFNWLPWLMAIAGFWLSSNLVIDLLVMPVMQVSGMAAQPEFVPAGYSLFWSFNRLELLCAAVLLTGILAVRRRSDEFGVSSSGSRCRWALVICLALLSLTLVDTYILTPEMSAIAVSLDFLDADTFVAPAMNWMHGTYWMLELVKLAGLGLLARLCYQDLRDYEFNSSDFTV